MLIDAVFVCFVLFGIALVFAMAIGGLVDDIEAFVKRRR